MVNMVTTKIRPGALSLMLQISRIAGVAPLSFKKLGDGYSITVSRFQLAYSFCFLTAFNLVGLVGMFLNLKEKKLDDFESYFSTVLTLSERMTCMLTCGMGYAAAIRMKNMINHINIMEQIRTKINYAYDTAKEDSIVKWICFFVITSNFIFILVEIVSAILRASECDHLTTAKEQAINKGICSFTQCYVSVCEVVTKINNADGPYSFFIYTSLALFSVFDGYGLILALNRLNLQYSLADIMIQCSWCILNIVRVTFFVEPYQRISDQAAEIKVLLSQLMYHMTPLGNQVSVELDITMKQVTLNIPKYCPLGINTLNRSLIIITLNAIITFLVFIIQIQS